MISDIYQNDLVDISVSVLHVFGSNAIQIPARTGIRNLAVLAVLLSPFKASSDIVF
jgi:hypothetical protein